MFKVLLPGELLVDKIKIYHQKPLLKAGGAPANVAATLSKFDVPNTFIGVIGNDENGDFLIKAIKRHAINVSGIIRTNSKTTIANVTVDLSGERSFSFIRGADKELSIKMIKNMHDIFDYDILFLGSATAFLGGDLFDSYNYLIADAMEQNKIIIFDPNYRKALYQHNKSDFIQKTIKTIENSNLIKVSEEELNIITNTSSVQEGIKKLSKYKNKIFLITLGAQGAIFVLNNQSTLIKSIKTKQIDSTGAGDAFIGYIVAQISEKSPSKKMLLKLKWEEIIKAANACSSIVVSRIGALSTIPTKKEIEIKLREGKWN